MVLNSEVPIRLIESRIPDFASKIATGKEARAEAESGELGVIRKKYGVK